MHKDRRKYENTHDKYFHIFRFFAVEERILSEKIWSTLNHRLSTAHSENLHG